MSLSPLEPVVRNDTIRFATMRPPGSPFATLDRRVIVTGPPELLERLTAGDVRTLEGLVPLLGDPDRSWAAEVALAALTGRDGKIVDAYAATPERWWDALGKSARKRWRTWLRAAKPKLSWDADAKAFLETR